MKYTRLFALFVALLLIAASCGSDDSETSEAAEATTSTEAAAEAEDDSEAMEEDEAEDAMEDVEEAEPEFASAIISLSPTATEMLFAIDAGDHVLAVDDFSNYPEDAAAKMQGLSGFEPNVEAIASLEPDLVVTDGTNPDFISQLDALGINHWEGPAAADFDDIYAQIEQLGAATGKVGEAAELVSSMSARVEAVTSTVATPDVALTFYHELDPTFYSVSPASFIGSV